MLKKLLQNRIRSVGANLLCSKMDVLANLTPNFKPKINSFYVISSRNTAATVKKKKCEEQFTSIT